jgi:gas vesicle protein
MQTGTKIILGTIAGAIAGTLTGMMIAPGSGKENREKIGKKQEEILGNLNDLAEKLRVQKDEVIKNIKKAKK